MTHSFDAHMDVTQTVLTAVEEQDEAHDPAVVVLSTGVVVRARAIPREAYMSIMGRFREPTVPRVFLQDRGRWDENPDDPEYLDALKHYRIDIANALTLAVYVMGAGVVDIPSGFPGPHDADWLEERELSGLSSGDTVRARALDWLRYKAATGAGDNAAIMEAVGRMIGVTEADAAAAAKSNGRKTGGRPDIRGRR